MGAEVTRTGRHCVGNLARGVPGLEYGVLRGSLGEEQIITRATKT